MTEQCSFLIICAPGQKNYLGDASVARAGHASEMRVENNFFGFKARDQLKKIVRWNIASLHQPILNSLGKGLYLACREVFWG